MPRKDDKIVVEWAQQRKQMHDLALAVPVGQVERDDVETGHLREGMGASLIRPVTEAYEQRSLVEPKNAALKLTYAGSESLDLRSKKLNVNVIRMRRNR